MFELVLLVIIFVVVEIGGDEVVRTVLEYAFRGRSVNPGPAGVVYICLGAMIGFSSAILLPQQLLAMKPPISGISLVLAPVIVGLLMHYYGLWRLRQAKDCSWLATFWGGSLFAFEIAFMRWIMIGRG